MRRNLFSGLNDRSLLLRNLLEVSSSSVYGILRSSPSGTLREEGGERRIELDSNLTNAVVLESVFFLLASGLLLLLG